MTSEHRHDFARRALVDAALREVQAGLFEVLEPHLRERLGDDWFDRDNVSRPTDAKDDAAFLLWIMTHESGAHREREDLRDAVRELDLRPAFFDSQLIESRAIAREVEKTERHRRAANAHELKHWRNMWAHQREFSAADCYRVIDCAQRLLRSIGDDRRADVVRVLADGPLEELVSGVGSFGARFPPRPLPPGGVSIAISWNDPFRGHLPTSFRYAAFRAGGILAYGHAPQEQFEDVIAGLDSSADGPVVVGLAFALSTPHWIFGGDGFATPADLWSYVAKAVESGGSLSEVAVRLGPPWWGSDLEMDAPPPESGRFRLTEEHILAMVRTQPKSAFELTGTGNVGVLSLAGIALLSRLRTRGYTVWPFEEITERVVIETFPRALGLHLHPTPISADTRQRFINSSDAHDAGIGSALAREMHGDFRLVDAVMTAWAIDRYGGGLADTPIVDELRSRIEGQIWLPE